MPFESASSDTSRGPKGLLKTLWRCIRNDPFEICWECSSEVMGQTRVPEAGRSRLRQTFDGMAYVLYLAFRPRREGAASDRSIEGKIFFFAKTDNQAHAVQPIVELLGQEAVKSDPVFLDWLLRRAALLSLPFLPVLMFRCLAATAYQRRTLPRCVSDYWLSYGLFLAACMLLRSRPAVLVVSNDHTVVPRAMTCAASFNSVLTAFVPHAGVIDGLPPLSVDIAFLDGLVAAQKYREFGSSRTKIFLAGNCRVDGLLQRFRVGRGAVLFCPGLADDAPAVLRAISAVVSAVPSASVTIRPHPREPARQLYLDAARNLGCQFSDARKERAEGALGLADIVVTGDSTVILEAKLARRWVAVFFSAEKTSDNYGYMAEGVPDAVCRNSGELIEFVRAAQTADPPVWDGIQKYMSTSGTTWEGRSAELIAASLREFARTGLQSRPASWERLDSLSEQPVFVPR